MTISRLAGDLIFDRIWVAMLTADVENADTDSPRALIVSFAQLNRSFPPSDKLFHALLDNPARGQANLYELGPEIVQPADISLSRAELVGGLTISTANFRDNAWHPQLVFVWGESAGAPPLGVIPLALDSPGGGKPSQGLVLSTDPGDAPNNSAKREQKWNPVDPFSPDVDPFYRGVLGVIVTANEPGAGTNSNLLLTLNLKNGGTQQRRFPLDTPQDDLERGVPNIYDLTPTTDTPPEVVGFHRNEILSLALSIEGDDKWLPSSFFLFGLDRRISTGDTGPFFDFPPTAVDPLVYLPEWPLGPLSTDHTEGRGQVLLPILERTRA